MKRCNACNEELSLENFNKSKSAKDGLQGRCRQCNKQAAKEWRKNNPERARANSLKQTELLKKRNPNYYNEWYRQNYATPEGRAKVIAIKNARRARLQQAEGRFTAEEFAELCLLYDGKCLACGTESERLTVDHVIPLSKGGSNSIDNIQPLCGPCNSKKGNRSSTDYRPDFAS